MLTIEQSARLLKAIYPNYPILIPRLQCPPPDTWRTEKTK